MAAAVLLVLVAHGANLVSRRMGDFTLYHRAAERLAGGEGIYRLEDPHRYLYAPAVTFLFLPFAPLPLVAGKILWYGLNLVVAAWLVQRTSALVWSGQRAPPGFVLLVALASLRFIDNNLGHGQINLLLFGWILAAYALAARGRFVLAGLSLAAAIVTKVFPAVLLLQLALRRQWRFAAATVAAVALLLLLPVGWWGGEYPEVLGDWAAVVRDQVGHYRIENKINQSITAFVFRLTQPHAGGWPLFETPLAVTAGLAYSVHAAFLATLVWISVRLTSSGERAPAGPRGDELALYLLYATVASPYSWKYYLIDFMLPLAAVARRMWEPPGRSRAAAFFAVAVLLNVLPGTRAFGKETGVLLQLWSFHFLSAGLLFVAILVELARSGGERAGRESASQGGGATV